MFTTNENKKTGCFEDGFLCGIIDAFMYKAGLPKYEIELPDGDGFYARIIFNGKVDCRPVMKLVDFVYDSLSGWDMGVFIEPTNDGSVVVILK